MKDTPIGVILSAGKGSRLGSYPLLEVSVRNNSISVMIDNLVSRSIIMLCQPPLGYGHTDSVGKPLTKRPRGGFSARNDAILRVSRCKASPLSKSFQFL